MLFKCRKRKESSTTFIAKLGTWAARLNTEPHLSKITLAHVIAGDTCAPISLSDFEAFLAFKAHSLEALHFIVWFQDYRKRFLKLPASVQALNQGSSTFKFNHPNVVLTERRAEESIAKLAQIASVQNVRMTTTTDSSTNDEDHPSDSLSKSQYCTTTNHSIVHTSFRKAPPIAPSPAQIALTSMIALPVTHSYTTLAPSELEPHSDASLPIPPSPNRDNFAEAEPVPVDALGPIRTECMNALATFLCPGSPKELLLDAIVRDTTIRNLSCNYHPDVFQPVYEEIYDLLEKNVLPRFLASASTMINRPKQLLWYSLGILYLILSVLSALSLILMVPIPPYYNRAWRLFPVFFAFLGFTTTCAAWRGFCSQLWFRGTTQLRVWEMQEMDEEAKIFMESVLKTQGPSTCILASSEKPKPAAEDQPTETENTTSKELKREGGGLSIPKPQPTLASVPPRSTSLKHLETDFIGCSLVTMDVDLASVHPDRPSSSPTNLPSAREVALVAPWASLTGPDDLPTKAMEKVPASSTNQSPPNLADGQSSQDGSRKLSFKALRNLIKPTPSQSTVSTDGTTDIAMVQMNRSTNPRPTFKRPPFFGPERAVLDPRIKAVHDQVGRDLMRVGLCYTLIFAAIVFSVPARRHGPPPQAPV